MKQIALLATGGTIASVESADGLAPGIRAQDLLKHLPPAGEDLVLSCKDVFSLDSSNIQPEEWRILAQAAYAALGESDAVVITHGTDTMAYSAAQCGQAGGVHGVPVAAAASDVGRAGESERSHRRGAHRAARRICGL